MDPEEIRLIIRAVIRGQRHKRHNVDGRDLETDVRFCLWWGAFVRQQQDLLSKILDGTLDTYLDERHVNLCFAPAELDAPEIKDRFSIPGSDSASSQARSTAK